MDITERDSDPYFRFTLTTARLSEHLIKMLYHDTLENLQCQK